MRTMQRNPSSDFPSREDLLWLPGGPQFIPDTERSTSYERVYRMASGYGEGTLRALDFNNLFAVLTADFVPRMTFEHTWRIAQKYLEIGCFDTDSSSYRVGRRRFTRVEQGIICHINDSRTVFVRCEAGVPACFTKIRVSGEYFDGFLRDRYGENYDESRDAVDFLSRSPNLPELRFLFRQIRDCRAEGAAKLLYMEGKILEALSLIALNFERRAEAPHLAVTLDSQDRRGLKRVVAAMAKDPAAYPSIGELARLARMSASRFLLAFRKEYGTTPYGYLQNLRMNRALALLQESDLSIGEVAARVGYGNSGHFAGLFKRAYGIGPKGYRTLHRG